MKKPEQHRNRKAYALVFVLMILLVGSLVGGYLLKRSSGLDERAQMSNDERRLRAAVVENFNFVAQRLRSRVETAINIAPAGELLTACTDQQTPSCLLPAVSEEEAQQMGVSWTVLCRGQGGNAGTPWQATSCTTDLIFPKDFLVRVQQRNPINPDEIIFATAEVRYQPIPLNAYALALTNAQNVNFGPGVYDGNIAINLGTSPNPANPYQVRFYPEVGNPVQFNGVVTVNDTDALNFPADPNREVIATGYRSSSQLGGLTSAFANSVDEALDNPANNILAGRDLGYFPAMTEPFVNGSDILEVAEEFDPSAFTEIAVSAPDSAQCRTEIQVDEVYQRTWRIKMPITATTPPAGFSFEPDENLYSFACNAPGFCHNGNACYTNFSDPTTMYCAVASGVTETVHSDSNLDDKSIIVSNHQKVVLKPLNIGDHFASGCGASYAVWAPNGSFEAKAGYRHFEVGRQSMDPPGEQAIKAAFVSGRGQDGGSFNGGVVHFDLETLAENGETLGSIAISGDHPDDGPTLRFDATIVGLGLQSSAVSFDYDLLRTDIGNNTLGRFESRGGQIAARSSDYRRVFTTGDNAGQVASGFDEVSHSFTLNESPVLESREFAANLDATVRNFSIEFVNPQEGVRLVNLNWDNSPVMNFVPSQTSNWWAGSSTVPVVLDTVGGIDVINFGSFDNVGP